MANTLVSTDATSEQTALKNPRTLRDLNFLLCIFCQKHSNDPLVVPGTKSHRNSSPYETLEADILLYKSAGIDIIWAKVLEDGTGRTIGERLQTNNAGWHIGCRVKYNKHKFGRLNKINCNSNSCETKTKLQNRERKDIKEKICIFCEMPVGQKRLHDVTTHNIDSKVRQCAIDLQDTKMLAKLSAGDMIAIEAKYHRDCLTNYYRRHQINPMKMMKKTD